MPKSQSSLKSAGSRSAKARTSKLTAAQKEVTAERYRQMLAELDAHAEIFRAQQRKDLMELGIQEQAFFERQCRLYTEEQLDMNAAQLEESLKIAEEMSAENKKKQLLRRKSRMSRLMIRVPVIPTKKGKRKSATIPSFVSVTGRVSFRRVPLAQQKHRGAKTTEPRSGRLGEIAYSVKGSPIRIESVGGRKGAVLKDQKASGGRPRLHLLGESFVV